MDTMTIYAHLSFLCIIAFITNGSCQSQIDISNPCNPTVFSRRPEQSVDIPERCENGTIIWQYPMAVLNVVFTVPDNIYKSEVCLGYIENKSIKRVVQVINGKPRRMSFPSPGKETCTKPSKQVSLKIIGPNVISTYAGYIPYQLYDWV